MCRWLPLALLLVVPLAFSLSPPSPPTVVWGEINASCPITSLAPGAYVFVESNGTVLASISLLKDGNVFRFGGPLASDPKLVFSGCSDANVVLAYPDSSVQYVLGSISCDGNVHALFYDLSDSNCQALFPAATYDVHVSIPSDCNGSIDGMVFRIYYGGTELSSYTLSGSKSTSLTVHVDGYVHGIPNGGTLTARVYKDSTYTSWTAHYYYGRTITWDIPLPCDAYFSSQVAVEQNVAPAASGSAGSETNVSSQSSSQPSSPPRAPAPIREVNRNAGSGTAPEKVIHPVVAQREDLNVNVPVSAQPSSGAVFGVPTDQAVIIAIVVLVALIVVIRFFV